MVTNNKTMATLIQDIGRLVPLTQHSLYVVVQGMKDRCNNPNAKSYSNYGGRGIEFEFDSTFEAITYLMSLDGWKDRKLQCDRIDNNGNYCPGNLRFITPRENNRKRRNNTVHPGVAVTPNGKFVAKVRLDKIRYGRVRETLEDALYESKVMVKLWEEFGVLPSTCDERRDLPTYISFNKTTSRYRVQKKGIKTLTFKTFPEASAYLINPIYT